MVVGYADTGGVPSYEICNFHVTRMCLFHYKEDNAIQQMIINSLWQKN